MNVSFDQEGFLQRTFGVDQSASPGLSNAHLHGLIISETGQD
jgi:hypothetical protein